MWSNMFDDVFLSSCTQVSRVRRMHYAITVFAIYERERERERNTEHAILDHCFRVISNLDLSRHGQVFHSRAGIFRLRAWRWALKAWCSALRACFSALRAWCWACAKCPQSLVNDWHVGLQVLIIPLRTCTFGGDVMVNDEGVTRCYPRKMKPTHCVQVWVFVIWVQTS